MKRNKIYAIGIMLLLMAMALSSVVSANNIYEIRAEAHARAMAYAEDNDIPVWKSAVRRYEMIQRSVLMKEHRKAVEEQADINHAAWLKMMQESVVYPEVLMNRMPTEPCVEYRLVISGTPTTLCR